MSTTTHYKAGVSFKGLDPVAIFIIIVAREVFEAHGIPQLWITSLTDGRHSSTSLHYKGKAVDLRVHNIPQAKRQTIANDLKRRLSPGFDVIYGAPDHLDHIHIEHDEK